MEELTIQDKEHIWDESRKFVAQWIGKDALEHSPSLIPLYAQWEKKLCDVLCEITQEYYKWIEGE